MASFPITPSQFRELAAQAVLAPSSHNTQPWLFANMAGRVQLIADRTRALPVNDPDDRELVISCGCALFNLRVAAAAMGLRAQAQAEAGGDPDLLADLLFSREAAEPELAVLARAVALRRTYRERFGPQAPEAAEVEALAAAAAREGATLVPLRGEARSQAAALVAEGDAIQWASASWRRELAAWMHPRRQGDGLAMPELAAPVARLVVRSFDMGHGVAARDRELADGSPLLTLLSTEGDTPADWLAAGQALQRALLTGVNLGLQASFLNQPVEVAALRGRLQALAGTAGAAGAAQLLVRWGRPLHALPAAPRRPLDDVLVAA